MSEISESLYFRQDQADGITPPNLAVKCTYAEHIVRARGKKSQYTSVSLDKNKIRDFGPQTYFLVEDKLLSDSHSLVEHKDLLASLRQAAVSSDKAERNRAIQAQRYARRRMEGLVDWNFDIGQVDRKNLITWSKQSVQPYFLRI